MSARDAREENDMDTMTQAPVAFEVDAEIRIEAGVEEVWRALTEDIGDWWPHSFTEGPLRIALEPWIGGRFYEQFDESGAGALYAVVTYLEPNKTLRVSGAMGMPGARHYVKTYRLQPDGDVTVVRTTSSTLGDIPDEMRENYRSGGEGVLAALKEHLEARA
jgi:uncharacterized protein YndB with AHSA1/START domain